MKTETPLHADIDTNQWFFNYDNSTPNSGGGSTPPKNFEFDFKIYVKLNMGH